MDKKIYIDANDVMYSKIPMYIGALLSLAKVNPKIHSIVDIDDFREMDKMQMAKFGIARKEYNVDNILRKRKYLDYDLSTIYNSVCDVHDVEVSNITKTLALYNERFGVIDICTEDHFDSTLVDMIIDNNKDLIGLNKVNIDALKENEYDTYIFNNVDSVLKLIEYGKDIKYKNIIISVAGYNSHMGDMGKLVIDSSMLELSIKHGFILSIIEPIALNATHG